MRLKLAITFMTAAATLAQEPAKRLEALKAKGVNAEVTVFPVLLAGRPFPQVGEVLGILLEKGGMQKLEMSSIEFRRQDPATMEQAAAAFSDFVRQNPIRTEYALYAEILGNPGAGVSEVRGILVDRAGSVVWSDRQTPEDEAFKKHKPGDPMECIVLLGSRLRETLGLADPLRQDAPEGPFARKAAERVGIPSQAERAGMKKSLEAARPGFGGAKVVVYPILIGGQVDRAQAARLARLLSQEKLGNTEVAPAGPALKVRQGPNEQERLWDMARGFREHLRRSPAAGDYAIYAEYVLDREGERVFVVHFALCHPNGDWVIVDFQNDHHKDFQSVAPKSGDDCDRLVVKRLAGYLR